MVSIRKGRDEGRRLWTRERRDTRGAMAPRFSTRMTTSCATWAPPRVAGTGRDASRSLGAIVPAPLRRCWTKTWERSAPPSAVRSSSWAGRCPSPTASPSPRSPSTVPLPSRGSFSPLCCSSRDASCTRRSPCRSSSSAFWQRRRQCWRGAGGPSPVSSARPVAAVDGPAHRDARPAPWTASKWWRSAPRSRTARSSPDCIHRADIAGSDGGNPPGPVALLWCWATRSSSCCCRYNCCCPGDNSPRCGRVAACRRAWCVDNPAFSRVSRLRCSPPACPTGRRWSGCRRSGAADLTISRVCSGLSARPPRRNVPRTVGEG